MGETLFCWTLNKHKHHFLNIKQTRTRSSICCWTLNLFLLKKVLKLEYVGWFFDDFQSTFINSCINLYEFSLKVIASTRVMLVKLWVCFHLKIDFPSRHGVDIIGWVLIFDWTGLSQTTIESWFEPLLPRELDFKNFHHKQNILNDQYWLYLYS